MLLPNAQCYACRINDMPISLSWTLPLLLFAFDHANKLNFLKMVNIIPAGPQQLSIVTLYLMQCHTYSNTVFDCLLSTDVKLTSIIHVC